MVVARRRSSWSSRPGLRGLRLQQNPKSCSVTLMPGAKGATPIKASLIGPLYIEFPCGDDEQEHVRSDPSLAVQTCSRQRGASPHVSPTILFTTTTTAPPLDTYSDAANYLLFPRRLAFSFNFLLISVSRRSKPKIPNHYCDRSGSGDDRNETVQRMRPESSIKTRVPKPFHVHFSKPCGSKRFRPRMHPVTKTPMEPLPPLLRHVAET
ncbi:hypothetical protein H6P81_002216 [Aristolochia fimbriata]|uniref:Uncharacterized protein n=1 Tax=Aristolochia fimbriata TaxID=158543 RepID=A0AAV7F9V2_ARIFI|nr:hypothetical protein H6P81_002216 [Aristolochia fimbriata]